MFEEEADAGVLAIFPVGCHMLPVPCICGTAVDDEVVAGVCGTIVVWAAPVLRCGDGKFGDVAISASWYSPLHRESKD